MASPFQDDRLDPLQLLPYDFVLAVFARVPVRDRLLLAGVSRTWCSALSEKEFWRSVDLCPDVELRPSTVDGLLRAVGRASRGGLERLELPARLATGDSVVASLREVLGGYARPVLLHLRGEVPLGELEPLLRACAAEGQHTVDVAEVSHAAVPRATALLRRERPLAALRTRELHVFGGSSARQLGQLASALAAFPRLPGGGRNASMPPNLEFDFPVGVNEPGVLPAIVDAAITVGLSQLCIHGAELGEAAAPAVARLLTRGRLTALNLSEGLSRGLLQGGGGAALAAGLRACATLAELDLSFLGLWDLPAAGAEVLDALVGHPALRTLKLCDDMRAAAAQPVAGSALARLVAANSPSLTVLKLQIYNLGDAGQRGLFEALRGNAFLVELKCSWGRVTRAFAAATILPCVRANVSLRRFSGNAPVYDWPGLDEVAEAEALVAMRPLAAPGAAAEAAAAAASAGRAGAL